MDAYLIAAGMMVASGSIHAVVNAIVKGRGGAAAGGSGGHAIMAGRAATDGVSALLLLPATALVPWPSGAWGWLAASAVVHVVYLFAMIRTYTVADFSAAYPVLRGTAPLVTAAVAIGVAGERVGVSQVAGIVLIGGALLMLGMTRHLTRAALGWAMLTESMTAAYTIADAHGVRATPTIASYIVWDFVLIGALSVVMFTTLGRGAMFAAMRRQWRAGAIAGALSIVTYGLALIALSLGPTAPLAALRETGMVTALLIGVFALGERLTVQRVAAVAAILAGAALILVG
jgi:drug/metabolite transporter (DMT)-like permease